MSLRDIPSPTATETSLSGTIDVMRFAVDKEMRLAFDPTIPDRTHEPDCNY